MSLGVFLECSSLRRAAVSRGASRCDSRLPSPSSSSGRAKISFIGISMSLLMSSSLLTSILRLSACCSAFLFACSSSSMRLRTESASKDLTELRELRESSSLSKLSSEDALLWALSSSYCRLRANCCSSVSETIPIAIPVSRPDWSLCVLRDVEPLEPPPPPGGCGGLTAGARALPWPSRSLPLAPLLLDQRHSPSAWGSSTRRARRFCSSRSLSPLLLDE
mmetsp:Transcript_58756/g.182525  ORF Transcript_58756/g.182525 Transcript_58756/m.182525 type:complete len:221 (+) Transcript_58756:419-1081(+)